MSMCKARKGSMMLLMISATLIASLAMPFLYLTYIGEKRINDTVAVCRETMELVGAANNHYINFMTAAGEYIDLVEQQINEIKQNYANGNITRSQMVIQLAALTSNPEQEAIIRSMWQSSGNTLAMPTGSESVASFIERLGIAGELNGNLSDSDAVETATVNSDIVSWVASPEILSHIPKVWVVEITVTPKDKFDVSTIRRHLLGGVKNMAAQADKCIKINVVRAEEDGISVKIEYNIQGMIDSNMSIAGM